MKHKFSEISTFQRDPLNFLLEKSAGQQPGLVPLHLGKKDMYLVTDPELVKPVLKMSEDKIDKGKLVHKLKKVIGDNSLTLSGEPHKKRRHIIHHHLAAQSPQEMVTHIEAVLIRQAAQMANEKVVELHDMTGALSLRLISTILFGHQVLSPGDEQVLVQSINSIEEEVATNLFRMLPWTPWGYYAHRKKIKNAKRQMNFVISQVRRNNGQSSLFAALDDAGLSDKQIQEEILTLLLAGHHTTGSSAAWMLYHLSNNPGLAQQIAEEREMLSDESGVIRADKMREATASLSLVKEVLRLYPASWWFSREVMETMELGGKRLKKGTTLMISPWQLHRDERLWDRPGEFDMNRSYNAQTYIPFGAGHRACVGMRLATLELQLMALEFSSVFDMTCHTNNKDLAPIPHVTLVPPKMLVEFGMREDEALKIAAE